MDELDLSGRYLLPLFPKCLYAEAAKIGPDRYACVWYCSDRTLPVGDTVGASTLSEWIQTGAWRLAYPACLRVSEGL